MGNKITIIKNEDCLSKVMLNGQTVNHVLDYSYQKKSATDNIEVTLKIDVSDIREFFGEWEDCSQIQEHFRE